MSNHATKSIKSVIGFLASLLLLLTGVAGCGASSQDSISGEAKPTNPRGASEQKTMTSDSALRKTVKLNSGYEMPMLGLGTWTLSNDVAEESAYFAYFDREIGVRTILAMRKMKNGGPYKPYAIIDQFAFEASVGELQKGTPL